MGSGTEPRSKTILVVIMAVSYRLNIAFCTVSGCVGVWVNTPYRDGVDKILFLLVTDGQTNRRTHGHSIHRASGAPHGKTPFTDFTASLMARITDIERNLLLQ